MAQSSSVSRADRKRTALLDAAAQLFAARPDTEAVSVDEVAALARVSKATLYRYFPNKAALVQAVAKREGIDPASWQVPDRRSQIVQAATRLIPQRGLRATTMEQIAEEAGISPATIYWHFASKDDLLIAVADHCSPLEIFRRNLSNGADSDPLDDLRRLLDDMLQHAAGRFEVVMTCVSESWATPRVAAHFMRTIAAPAWSVIGGYFDAQVKAGRFKPAPFFPRLLSLAGPVWAYLITRRAMTGVAAQAAQAGLEQPILDEPRPGGRGGHGFNPIALMLSMAASHAAHGQETTGLDPDQMVETHIQTFLAGNATPAYLRELERRRATGPA